KDLAGVASKILGIEEGEIEPDVNLHEYGFDPVLLAEFANRIGQKYRLEADLALPMEAPTLAETNEGLEPQETFGQETRDSHHRPPGHAPRPHPPA
ncbi:MAG: acyl carrier protein, partial [Desulfobacterales bacterium]|nr:acyl carrier protein [Desulfobacterales bacterium]